MHMTAWHYIELCQICVTCVRYLSYSHDQGVIIISISTCKIKLSFYTGSWLSTKISIQINSYIELYFLLLEKCLAKRKWEKEGKAWLEKKNKTEIKFALKTLSKVEKKILSCPFHDHAKRTKWRESMGKKENHFFIPSSHKIFYLFIFHHK